MRKRGVRRQQRHNPKQACRECVILCRYQSRQKYQTKLHDEQGEQLCHMLDKVCVNDRSSSGTENKSVVRYGNAVGHRGGQYRVYGSCNIQPKIISGGIIVVGCKTRKANNSMRRSSMKAASWMVYLCLVATMQLLLYDAHDGYRICYEKSAADLVVEGLTCYRIEMLRRSNILERLNQ